MEAPVAAFYDYKGGMQMYLIPVRRPLPFGARAPVELDGSMMGSRPLPCLRSRPITRHLPSSLKYRPLHFARITGAEYFPQSTELLGLR